jgi:hypothetical protein
MYIPTFNLSNYWLSFYSLYGSAISTLSNKWYNQEAIYGSSCTQYKLNQYYLAFQLGAMVRFELDKGYESSYSYYNIKYGLDDKKKILSCNNINLNDILDIFDIVFIGGMGIGNMGIGESFSIEPNQILTIQTVVDITTLLTNTNDCVTIFNDCL